MFQRILFEDGSILMAMIAFFFTASVFTYVSIRALKLSKSRREELANLPLNDSTFNH